MTEYEMLVAEKFYYEMYNLTRNQDWLDAAHEMTDDLISFELKN